MRIKNQKSSFHKKREGRRGQSPLRPLRIKKTIGFLLIFSLILPSLSFAQKQPLAPPETLEGAKEIGGKTIHSILLQLPETLKRIWREEVLPIWQKIYNWLKKTFWDPYLSPFFKREIEKRKPIIEEEFEKEKKEMKEEVKTELPKIGKSLWERFKELIK